MGIKGSFFSITEHLLLAVQLHRMNVQAKLFIIRSISYVFVSVERRKRKIDKWVCFCFGLFWCVCECVFQSVWLFDSICYAQSSVYVYLFSCLLTTGKLYKEQMGTWRVKRSRISEYIDAKADFDDPRTVGKVSINEIWINSSDSCGWVTFFAPFLGRNGHFQTEFSVFIDFRISDHVIQPSNSKTNVVLNDSRPFKWYPK